MPADRVDAAAEADVWRHADVRAADAGGLVLRAAAASRWREDFVTSIEISDDRYETAGRTASAQVTRARYRHAHPASAPWEARRAASFETALSAWGVLDHLVHVVRIATVAVDRAADVPELGRVEWINLPDDLSSSLDPPRTNGMRCSTFERAEQVSLLAEAVSYRPIIDHLILDVGIGQVSPGCCCTSAAGVRSSA